MDKGFVNRILDKSDSEEYVFNIQPVAKPRMTQKDKWKKSAVKYFAFANMLRYLANQQGLETLPEKIKSLVFHYAMAESWSNKKKKKMEGQPHRQRPDLSNMLKSIEDVLCRDDSHIWHYGTIEKRWAYEGKIILIIQSRKP